MPTGGASVAREVVLVKSVLVTNGVLRHVGVRPSRLVSPSPWKWIDVDSGSWLAMTLTCRLVDVHRRSGTVPLLYVQSRRPSCPRTPPTW